MDRRQTGLDLINPKYEESFPQPEFRSAYCYAILLHISVNFFLEKGVFKQSNSAVFMLTNVRPAVGRIFSAFALPF